MIDSAQPLGPGVARIAGSLPEPIRVLLIADIRLYREGLSAMLRRVNDLAVVAVAAGRDEALRAAAECQPDVIVLDAAMIAAPDALRELAAASLAPLVALDVPVTGDTMVTFAEAGVVGYVGREGSVDDVVRTIRSARRGDVACEPALAATLVRSVHSSAAHVQAHPPAIVTTRPALAALTAREQEIAILIASEGLSNKEIAERLVIELPTVKNHVHNVLVKLGVRRRSQAAARMRELEPVQPI